MFCSCILEAPVSSAYNKIPDISFFLIFQFLNIRDYIRASAVNKEFNRLTTHQQCIMMRYNAPLRTHAEYLSDEPLSIHSLSKKHSLGDVMNAKFKVCLATTIQLDRCLLLMTCIILISSM